MKKLVATFTALLGAFAEAQSPLLVAPTGGAFFAWPAPSPDHQSFFDLTVHAPITVQAIAAPLVSPAGQRGTIEVWLTNAGIGTFVGNETNAANWHFAASGTVTANGTVGTIAQLTCRSCQGNGNGGLVLQPGSYGCAIRYGGVANRFYAVPNTTQSFSTAELTVHGGAVQYHAFASPPAFAGGGYVGWHWFGEIHYANGAVPHACAESLPFGLGCNRRRASICRQYDTATAAATALNGRSVTFLPNLVGGYDLLPGIAAHAYVAPTGNAFPVPRTNDSEFSFSPLAPFPYQGGLASTLFVHSNGYVSVGSNTVLGGPNWFPAPSALLAAPATGWWVWHDLNPTEITSGPIWIDEDPGSGVVRITWFGVESYPTNVVNPSTFQMVFDPNIAAVTIHFVSIDTIGGSPNPGNDRWVVGFSPGGPSADPGTADLTAVMDGTTPPVTLTAADVESLVLAASGPPMLGTTFDLTTTGDTGNSVGVLFVSPTPLLPGIDLAFLGAPGCAAFVDIGQGFGFVITNTSLGAMTAPLTIPNDLALLDALFFGQSIWLDATANAFGIVTSNGLALQLGNH